MKNLDKYYDLAVLLLRVGVGLIFIVAGWGKLNGIEGTAGFFDSLGIPLPVVMAWVVAIVEFVGGIMVLTGFFTRYPAVLLAIIMVVAIFTAKLGADNPFQAMRLDLALLCMSLALMIMGSGKYSIDSMMGND
jgi:putative oxidoreductase